MIECIQNRDYIQRSKRKELSYKMFNKDYDLLDDHERNEVRIQLKRILKGL